MAATPNRFEDLMNKYVLGELTDSQRKELIIALSDPYNNELLEKYVEKTMLSPDLQELNDESTRQAIFKHWQNNKENG